MTRPDHHGGPKAVGDTEQQASTSEAIDSSFAMDARKNPRQPIILRRWLMEAISLPSFLAS